MVAAAPGDRGRLGSAFARAAVAAAWLLAAPSAFGHPFEVTDVDVVLRDVTFRIDITFHVDAMLADVPLGDLTDEQYRQLRSVPEAEIERRLEMVRRYFAAMVAVRFDGARVDPGVRFPVREQERDGDRPALPGHLVRLEGAIPPGARRFTFSAAPVFNLIVLRIAGEHGEPVEQVFDPLSESEPYLLDRPAPVPSRLDVLRDYLYLGFVHILPRGLDHILFVLGLYLLSVRAAALLWQVTAFTLAHTLTLALSVYGFVRLEPALVEPLIALSIAYVAVENLLTAELKPWRPVVVFGFGLLHGLGFAGVLVDLGLPRARFLTAVIGFNAGVEAGQLAVLALALLLSGWWRSRPWYRRRIVRPASAAIGLAGGYWAVARAIGGV